MRYADHPGFLAGLRRLMFPRTSQATENPQPLAVTGLGFKPVAVMTMDDHVKTSVDPMTFPEDVVAAAAQQLALELDIELADYVGDPLFRLSEDDDVQRPRADQLWDEALLAVLGWLRDRWDYKKPNHDMRRIAIAVLSAAEKQRAKGRG
jgi:hypothetical protein